MMSSTRPTTHRPSPAAGFTLIELLVAVLIFSIGLLGVSSMQIAGLRSSQMSFMRSQATQIGFSMADRMRANRQGANAGDYDGAAEASDTDCEANSCTPAQMAAFDKDAWLTELGLLPSGAGVVTNNGSGSFTITVRWDQERKGATGTNCPPQSSADLRCYQVEIVL